MRRKHIVIVLSDTKADGYPAAITYEVLAFPVSTDGPYLAEIVNARNGELSNFAWATEKASHKTDEAMALSDLVTRIKQAHPGTFISEM